jgi:hypothetical protein
LIDLFILALGIYSKVWRVELPVEIRPAGDVIIQAPPSGGYC